MTPLKFSFYALVATFAMISGLLWEAGIGHEVPGVLLAKAEELLVKSAVAAKNEIVPKDDVQPIAEEKPVTIPEPETYVVRRGDWLSKIAVSKNVSIEALVKANRELYPSLAKNPGLIHPGWTLIIPIASATATLSSPEKSVLKKQNVYPETTAKAVPRDKHRALSKEGTPKRIAQKERRGASRHPETALRLKLSMNLTRIETIVRTYSPIVEKASSEYAVPKHYIYGLIYHESGGNPNAIGDGGRSRGLMQLHDPTRIRLGLTKKEAHDPEKAILAGTKYLREQYDAFGRNTGAAISAYNAPWLTQKMIERGTDPSKRDYVRSVKAAASLFKEYEARASIAM